MKRVLFLFAIALLLLGCAQQEDLTGFKNCGTDKACIALAAKSCEKAFGTVTQTSTEPNASMDVKVIIYGFEQSNCRIKYKIENVALDPANANNGQLQIMAAMLQGKEMICQIPQEQLQSDNLASLPTIDIKTQCSGSLADVLNQLNPA